MKNAIKQPFITSHHYYALPLSIICSEPGLARWIYSEFVQLYTHRDRNDEQMHVRFYNNNNEMYLYEPLDGVSVLPKQMTDSNNVISLFKAILNDGQYILDFVDHYYIKSFAIDKHYMHDILIYGYDDNLRVLHAYAYQKMKLSMLDISYSEYEDAYNSDYQKSQYHCMVIYRKKDEVFYPNITRIGNHLLDYLGGINTFDREAPLRVDLYKPKFGLNIYDELKLNIQYVREKRLKIDVPDMCCVYDHKRFMHQRVIYLDANTAVKCPNDLMNMFWEVEKIGRIMILQAMKLNQRGLSNKMDLQNFMNRFDIMKDLEKVLLSEYYEINRSAFENT